MHARAICGHYWRLILALADGADANADWQKDLSAILEQLRIDLAGLGTTSSEIVRCDLCEQLELSGHGATTPERRTVLFSALKQIELGD